MPLAPFLRISVTLIGCGATPSSTFAYVTVSSATMFGSGIAARTFSASWGDILAASAMVRRHNVVDGHAPMKARLGSSRNKPCPPHAQSEPWTAGRRAGWNKWLVNQWDGVLRNQMKRDGGEQCSKQTQTPYVAACASEILVQGIMGDVERPGSDRNPESSAHVKPFPGESQILAILFSRGVLVNNC